MFRKLKLELIVILLFVAAPVCAPAQNSPTTSTTIASNAALMDQLVALRDSFVSQLKREGFQPSLPPPTIILDNPPSYGNYEDGKNLLHIADWDALSADEQARFARLAARLGRGQTGEQAFDDGVHHWSSYMSLVTGGKRVSTKQPILIMPKNTAQTALPQRTGG
jgi:hypothetical protein